MQRRGLLVLAVFVVVIHHVVGAHCDGADTPAMAAHAHPYTTSPAPHTAVSGATVASDNPVLATATTVPSALGVDPTSGPVAAALDAPDLADHVMATLHLCLAVLAAVMALAALLSIAVALGGPAAPAAAPTGRLPHFPRPPPAGRRQARLQVLRL